MSLRNKFHNVSKNMVTTEFILMPYCELLFNKIYCGKTRKLPPNNCIEFYFTLRLKEASTALKPWVKRIASHISQLTKVIHASTTSSIQECNPSWQQASSHVQMLMTEKASSYPPWLLLPPSINWNWSSVFAFIPQSFKALYGNGYEQQERFWMNGNHFIRTDKKLPVWP